MEIVFRQAVVAFFSFLSFRNVHVCFSLSCSQCDTRSVTLVGEKERKMLKEVVKHAKTPLKSRIVPPGILRPLFLKSLTLGLNCYIDYKELKK